MSTNSYNCLIVDDEPPARQVLRRYIEKLPLLNLVGECSNAVQVISMLHQQPIDLLLLDIKMPQLSGLELVSALPNPPKIIFTTAFAEFALQSYDLDAVDYLLKPIKFERFIKAINKALPLMTLPAPQPKEPVAENEAFLYFRADRKMVKVVLKEILYVESLKDYVRIMTESGQVITKYSITALEAMLPTADFIRIHRSFIISSSKMHSYTASNVQIGNSQLPIGKSYQREVLKLIPGLTKNE
ncbi:LytTR family DNA-binding domain-containing protein [Dyadobacter sp. CY347]|uniref:LytR/AlgR family response regulator transcription factor n=1 Tax=Dyadobacter sp. CY347 TaxID=2909336 RepID=UPI001F2E9A1C|nr:LytTR family DNA-binding domain-containing protein [Dyadobacter sp. CY347]MCF2489266.1 LytTR family DNA-binding domain-containing protein [Dyadobacter sp. CY347]